MPTSYAFKLAMQSLKKDKWINLLSMLTIFAGLFIISISFFVFYNIERATQNLPEKFSLVVYLDTNLSQEKMDQVIITVKSKQAVSSVKFISREERFSIRTAWVLALALSATEAMATCRLEDSGAATVYELSGQGNFSCADLGMNPVNIAPVVLNPAKTQVTAWGSPNASSPGLQVDAVVVDPSSGKRCVYNYAVAKTGSAVDDGEILTASDPSAIKGVFACADTNFLTPPEPDPIPPEVDVSCAGQAIGTDPDKEEYLVVTAFSLDGAAGCTGAQSEDRTQYHPYDTVNNQTNENRFGNSSCS